MIPQERQELEAYLRAQYTGVFSEEAIQLVVRLLKKRNLSSIVAALLYFAAAWKSYLKVVPPFKTQLS
jgi:hypothetical protein